MKITSFNFRPGKSVGGKYEIIELLGEGYEGEVYLIKESATGIERAAKFFYPHRNQRESASMYYAKKLHKLTHCSAVIQYHFRGTVQVKGEPVSYLVSEFMDGEKLSDYIESRPGKRLTPFEALHVIYALVKGMIEVHNCGEYHGDIHAENVMINKKGIGFEVKVIDLYNFGKAKSSLQKDDVVDIIGVLYECIGGKKHYAKMPQEIKTICCGLKRTLILKKFPSLSKLQTHLETFNWE